MSLTGLVVSLRSGARPRDAAIAGIIGSRRVGRTRLVSANTASPYFDALRRLLVSAFGVPGRLRLGLAGIDKIEEVYIFGSWAARWHGEPGTRPVGDIDVLVLGHPDREQLYAATHEVGLEIGREIQAQIRAPGWLSTGTGSFHDTVKARPLVKVLPADGHDTKDETSATGPNRVPSTSNCFMASSISVV